MDQPSLGPLWRRRYDAEPPAGPMPANAVLELLLSHRTLRHFLTTPLPEGTLEAVMAAAQSAATSSNMQAWSVVAVQDPARRARLAELSAGQAFAARAPLFLVFLADTSRLRRMSQRHGEPMEGLDYLELFLVAAVDAALAAQNAVLAAESLGLGTCYIGALRNRPEEVAAELNLPPGAMGLFGLCIGYPDPAAPAPQIKPRLPQSAVLHHECYDPAPEQAAIAHYDAAFNAFSVAQGIGPQGWIRRMFTRLGSAASLQGRHTLKETLLRMGFPLR